MREHDWDAEAVRAANVMQERSFRAHRGAMPWSRPGVVVVFGNDGSRRGGSLDRGYFDAFRVWLSSRDLNVLGFGLSTSEAGYTWALMVRAEGDEDELANTLHEAIWDAWEETRPDAEHAAGVRAVQSPIAWSAAWKFFRPDDN